MELPRPVLPLQRSSSYPEPLENQSRQTTRTPLGESDGNAQHHQNVGTVAFCSQSISGLTPLPLSIPTPPIVPTQAFDSHYPVPVGLRLRRHQLQLQRRLRHGINPIYLSPQFQQYRKKQAEKDGQIWPDILEDAFLDALLVIPQMGRRKYTMRGQQYGRNMLISEYLWVAYCLSLAPGEKPNKLMKRERKQVSSHIQVLKNFFTWHRCYHFFFPGKEKKDDRKDLLDGGESFKDNPVLRALSEHQLPDERPNYEYFAQLLASDSLITVRPSLCWILVSSTAVKVEVDGPLRGKGYTSDGKELDAKRYPHLHLNLKREEWPHSGKVISGTLLQEYARELVQKEATSVKDIAQEWEENFPELYESLCPAVEENLRDMLHFHVTLDVQEPDRFPEGSDLNSLVEIAIEQSALQNHSWRSVTRLARPWELTRGEGTDPPVVEVKREIGNQFMHRPSCEDHAHCDCFLSSRLRRQQLAVPFPANEWATMLSLLAHYPKHRPAKTKHHDGGSGAGGSAKDADEMEPTQVDLVGRTAMFQELWSCPPEGRSWTRHAVILWTFETTYSNGDRGVKGPKANKTRAGTSWRFLTAVDPTSQYHQQQALVSPPSAVPVQRDAIMSPNPGLREQLNAAMSENFGSAWDPPATLTLASQQHHMSASPYGPGAMGMLDSAQHGLATPPPSAALQSSYPHSFDLGHGHGHGQPSLMSTASAAHPGSTLIADHFLSSAGDIGVYEDAGQAACGAADALQGWNPGGMAAGFGMGWGGGELAAVGTVGDLVVSGPHGWTATATTAAADDWGTMSSSPTSDGRDSMGWHDPGTAGGGPAPGWMHQALGGPAPSELRHNNPSWGADGLTPHQGEGQLVHRAQPGGGSDRFTGVFGAGISPLKAGQKRLRSDSLDDRENYPLSAIPKLAHHVGDGAGGGKYSARATMMENEHEGASDAW